MSSLHCPSLVRIPLCWFSQKSPTRRFPFINFISPMTPCSFAKSPLAYPVFEAELSYGVLCCSLRAVVLSKMPLLLRLPSSSGFLCYGAAQKRHRSVHIYTHASTTVHIHRCTKTHMDTAHMQHAHHMYTYMNILRHTDAQPLSAPHKVITGASQRPSDNHF